VPQSSGASTYRAIAFTDFGWFVAQGHANAPAMAAALMFSHRRFPPNSRRYERSHLAFPEILSKRPKSRRHLRVT
jgi:hypothetical protein